MGILCFLAVLAFSFGLSVLLGFLATAGRPALTRWALALGAYRRAERKKPVSVLRDEAASGIPALNRVVGDSAAGAAVRRALDQADLQVRPMTWLLSSLVLAGCAAGAVSVGRPAAPWPWILMAGAGAATLPTLYVWHRRRRRFNQIETQLPDALRMMAGALLAGQALTGAIERVATELQGPVAAEFRKIFAEQMLGVDLAVALAHFAERVPRPDVEFFVAAVRMQKDAGGNLAELLHNLCATVRERFRLRRQVVTLSAQGRLTGKILGLMPIAVGFLMYLGNPDYLSIFWTEKIGRMMLWALAFCQMVGYLIIRKIVRIRI